jgi:hypothetical protein
MTCFIVIRVVVVCLCVGSLAALSGCTCQCPPLTIDQKNAVGTFISLSKSPTDRSVPPEVGPARIRAIQGEEVIWVFRNPSSVDVRVNLEVVKSDPLSTTNIIGQVFQDPGPTVTVPKDCGYGWIGARLRTDVPVSRGKVDSCAV